MNITIIKLGGSLMGSAELASWLNSIEAASKRSNIILVPGGGKFADSIRNLQKTYQFNDGAAHQMALLAMCQYAHYLLQINSGLKLITDKQQIEQNLDKNQPLLWLPYSLINDDSELEQSWDVTSDSIALWLATKLEAKKLILVKSKPLDNDRKQIINHIKNNDLDKGFQRLIEKYSGEVLFFNKDQYSEL